MDIEEIKGKVKESLFWSLGFQGKVLSDLLMETEAALDIATDRVSDLFKEHLAELKFHEMGPQEILALAIEHGHIEKEKAEKKEQRTEDQSGSEAL